MSMIMCQQAIVMRCPSVQSHCSVQVSTRVRGSEVKEMIWLGLPLLAEHGLFATHADRGHSAFQTPLDLPPVCVVVSQRSEADVCIGY